MQVDILNIKGEKTGRSVELPDEIFGVEPNDHVIYLAVKQYLAAQRQGTHKVKTRAGSKRFKQKTAPPERYRWMPVKVISVTLCIKVVVLSSDQNHTIMISN